MARHHLKRLCAPPSWGVLRKEETFITRPHPGSHRLSHCFAIGVLLKRLACVTTSREGKRALLHNAVLIDGKKAKSYKSQAGLMDEIVIGDNCYRMLIDTNGHLIPVPITTSETGVKPCKITGKTMTKGSKMQLTTYDARTILLDKPEPYSIGDTLMIEIPKQRIAGHHKLESGAFVYLTGGKHLGDSGNVTSVTEHTIAYKNRQGHEYTTLKSYAFVLGKETCAITLP